MPTWVAASPTPSASCMTPIIRSVSRASSSSNSSTSLARIRSTGIAVLADLRQRHLAPRALLGAIVLIVLVLVAAWSWS